MKSVFKFGYDLLAILCVCTIDSIYFSTYFRRLNSILDAKILDSVAILAECMDLIKLLIV